MTPIYQQDRRPTVKRVRWMLLIGALLLVAAFVALPIVAHAQVASIAVTLAKNTIATGDATQATARGRTSSGGSASVSCAWSVIGSAASVSASGLVTGSAPGTAAVICRSGAITGGRDIKDTARSVVVPPQPTPTPGTPGRPSFSVTSAGPSSSSVTAQWAAAANATNYAYTSGLNAGAAWPGQNGSTIARSAPLTGVPNGASIWLCANGVNSAGAGSSACNSFTVPGGVVPPIDTAKPPVVDTTTPPPIVTPPTDTTSHEPPGLSLILERSWSAMKELGWYDDNAPTKYSIVQDTTAPRSPANVGQQKYPAGMGAGGSPAVAEKGIGSHQTLYVSYWVKLSSNWVGHSSGVNKQIFVWQEDQPGVYTTTQGSGTGRLSPEIHLQGTGGTVNLEPNVLPTFAFTRGVWHRWELLLVNNSAGQSNGRATWWIDGTLVGDRTAVRFSSGGGPFNLFQWSPTYGGMEGNTVPADQFMWMDHVYISGK
jgi:hypothetical protein